MNRKEVNIRGKINVNIQITESCSVNVDMLVINESPFDIILGHNFLEKFDYILMNYKTQPIVLESNGEEILYRSTTNAYMPSTTEIKASEIRTN